MSVDRDKSIVWAKVNGTNGCYEVSNMGEVRSLFYNNRNVKMRKREKPIVLKQSTDKKGYKRVSFAIDGKKASMSVHKIILISFGFEKPEGLQCAHLNGNPSDNRLVNLKWCTPKENQSHRKEHGTYRCGEDANPAKLNESEVKTILERVIVNGDCIKETAKKYVVNTETIRSIIQGRTWKHIDKSKYSPAHKKIETHKRRVDGKFIGGDNHPERKLNSNQVLEIRKIHSEKYNSSYLAKKYGVSKSTINRIISRKRWKSI